MGKFIPVKEAYRNICRKKPTFIKFAAVTKTNHPKQAIYF